MTRELGLFYGSIIIYTIFITAEIILSNYKNQKSYQIKDSGLSIWFAIAGGTLDFLMRGVCFLVLDYFNQHAIWKPNLINLYPIWAWLFVFICQDFFFYWLHRAEHNIRLLWAVHSNHHSSRLFNFTVALRSSVLQPLYRFLFYIPIALFGFDGLTIMFVYAINQIYQFFLHTEFLSKWNRLGLIFVTPSHHRVHHANNKEYLDRNMGQVLIIWDKLLGTFQEELENIKPTYGLTHQIDTYHPIKSIFIEFVRLFKDISTTKRFADKAKLLINSPSWKPQKTWKTHSKQESLL